ncbi:MAG: hypothetical protein A3G75_06925 [Verrucomicrobia bacterium RIFCSPLOWO2_12_FULL_64_8]|nr:MAG: hypothetical protein A3G75_06925 [Verrucomicrobia bacterium RIFCSPLOWO2_12_FULL_64_8]
MLAVVPLPAITLADLDGDPKLSPKRYAGYFEHFGYEYSPVVQPADVFLAREKGDCDDYAALADRVLAPKGYGTRLIQVRVAGLTVDHVVCYVNEAKAYLDYNNRAVFLTLTHAGATIREIATKVAKSFDANWTSASEFTYKENRKQWLATVVKTDPPERDPVAGQSGAVKIRLDF